MCAQPAGSAVRVTRFEVRDATGVFLAVHVREDRQDRQGRPMKRMWWELPNGRRGLGGRSSASLPLYGVDQLDRTPRVVVVEGERKVAALRAAGVQAVGTVTGASSCPTREALAELTGRSVVLWPDADEIGRRHMQRVAAGLAGIAAEVRWLEPPGDAPKGWDVADAVAAGWQRERIEALLGAAVPVEPALDDAGERPEIREAVVTRFSDVEPLPAAWLWPGWVPAGMLTVLDGDPGRGKSTLTLDIAARLSRGDPMPDGSGGGKPAGAVVLTAEDDLARVVRPRLDAAGADVERIATVKVRGPDGLESDPVIRADDLPAVERAIDQVSARLVIIDPLVAFLDDGVNINRDHDVRRALAPLAALAERTGAAVLVVRHLRKAAADTPLYRGGGSIGIIGAARAGLLVALDPDDPSRERRVLAVTKANLAPMPTSLSFGLVVQPGGTHPIVAWGAKSPHSADTLLEPSQQTQEHRTALGEATDVLREILHDGPVRSQDAKREARAAGVASRTLDRARRALGVVARKSGQPGSEGQRWTWALPEVRQDSRSTPSIVDGALRGSLAHFGEDAAPPEPAEYRDAAEIADQWTADL